MFKHMSITTLAAAIIDRIQAGAGVKCYDVVPKDEVPPFAYIQVTRTYPADSKTMFIKGYDVWVHCFDDNDGSHVDAYGLINDIQEAMTEDITLPEPFCLVYQADNGTQTIQDEEDGTTHAVIGYTFKVSYGYKVKV